MRFELARRGGEVSARGSAGFGMSAKVRRIGPALWGWRLTDDETGETVRFTAGGSFAFARGTAASFDAALFAAQGCAAQIVSMLTLAENAMIEETSI